MNLRIPGPTPLPPATLEAVGKQMIGHRGPEFEALFSNCTAWLKEFFETRQDLYILTSSGTGAMEAAIVNTLSAGDKVLSVVAGGFGERFAKIAEAYGADVTRMIITLGEAADPEAVANKIAADGPYKAVLLTQNETSTAVTNDIQALAAAIHGAADPSPLILVDGVSGMAGIRLSMDAWGVDVALTGAQKALMTPPGLAFIGFGKRAWEAYETAKMPKFYFDLGLAKKYAQRNQTPTTPNIPALYALEASLKAMREEGADAIYARHARIAAYCRQKAVDMGLRLFGDPAHYSNTVTGVLMPEGVQSADVLRRMSEEHGVVCGGSKAPGIEMIRIGHMGNVCEADIDGVYEALAAVLAD